MHHMLTAEGESGIPCMSALCAKRGSLTLGVEPQDPGLRAGALYLRFSLAP